MKKNYIQPEMNCVLLQHQTHLLVDSVHEVEGNASLNYGGARGGFDARTKEDDWDELWDE